MQFIADLEPVEDGGLQIMYGIDGRRDLTESTLDELSGYAGAPVRIGNGAFDQLQNDVGEEQRARDLMERLLRVASPLGLYAEEFDADTGPHLGNFPQAFSHLAAGGRRAHHPRRATGGVMH